MARFFIDPSQIQDNHIQIVDQDVKHIRDVLRLEEGAEILICDGQGIDYKCIIKDIGKQFIIATIAEKDFSKTEPQIKATLFQSLIKGDKFEWVIQKAIEIGVYQIIPMTSTNCVVKVEGTKKMDTKLQRWNKIAESAAKQSGRGIIPKILHPMDYTNAVNLCSQMDLAYIPYEKEDSLSLRTYLERSKSEKVKTIGILIGPEGGFTQEEVYEAQTHKIQPVTLGQRILRSETAAVVSLSNTLYDMGEMEK